jgi:hypothetical protein
MRSHDKGDLSAVTQVKVSSPEIIHIAQGQGFHLPETNIVICDKGEHITGMPGSKSTAGKSTVYIGTWENRKAPKGNLRQAEEARKREGDAVVGLIHSRGVSKVILVEDMKFTRRSQQYNGERQ